MDKKTITFLMPGTGKYPSGGMKVIYEQSNRLIEKGYYVNIVYPIQVFIKRKSLKNFLGIIKRYFQGFLLNNFKAKWFTLDSQIKEVKVFSLKQKNVPISDYYCATSLETSFFLNEYNISSDKKIYYIQGYEIWNVGEPYTSISYKFAMKKIAIAPFLLEKINKLGEQADYIPDGFDFKTFGIDIPIEKRKSHTAIMMYSSNNSIKRCSDSIAALKIVKEKFADLQVFVFGIPARPSTLPDWFKYHQTPNKELLRKLYNSAAVFVASSATEGMGLPPAEAAICGCALCCTDIGGFRVFAKQNETALLSPVYDIDALAENIFTVMSNDKKRIALATSANKLLQNFTWEKANDLFIKLIER